MIFDEIFYDFYLSKFDGIVNGWFLIEIEIVHFVSLIRKESLVDQRNFTGDKYA